MINALIGKKIDQTQSFLENGTRIPVTKVLVSGNTVVMVKTKDKNGYSAIQLGFGVRKHPTKAMLGHTKRIPPEGGIPYFLREVRIENDIENFTAGSVLNPQDVFKPGDIIEVTGVSKGKGFAGVVKRHHFKGGPRTHGQSDRERAPGSIGQTTTPGRVYKGKRMAGRMGAEKATIKNLRVIDVTDKALLIKGLIPGGKNGLVVVTKVSEDKKFVPLYKEEDVSKVSEVSKGEKI